MGLGTILFMIFIVLGAIVITMAKKSYYYLDPGEEEEEYAYQARMDFIEEIKSVFSNAVFTSQRERYVEMNKALILKYLEFEDFKTLYSQLEKKYKLTSLKENTK
jgi:hypothetical protein